MDTTTLKQPKPAAAAPRTQIRSVRVSDPTLVVAWGDGHESRFHFIWLRHNCRCEKCYAPGTASNLVFVPDIAETLWPLTAEVDAAGNLAIVWNQEKHTSSYAADWLRDHCYSAAERKRRRHVPTTWGCEKSADLPIHPYAEFFEDAGKLRALGSLRDLGFALLRGGPTVPDQVDKVAPEIGPLRETSFGRILEVKANPTLKLLAYAPEALVLHMDDVYRWCILNINVFHCIQADATGGGVSVLVDGFKVAEVLRRENPDAFDILARTPIL
jgi:gamma-butyrobetaine dioxygenase